MECVPAGGESLPAGKKCVFVVRYSPISYSPKLSGNTICEKMVGIPTHKQQMQ